MSVVKRISLLCALSAAAGAAHAVGLGAIQLESSLNQPLRATVALRDVDPDTVSELRVRLAPAERFEAAGLIRDDYLRNLSLFTETDAQGRPVIRIRGEGPLREPMLDLLIEAREGRQIVQRGYTLLVDPPEMAREPSVAQAEPAREPEPEPVRDLEPEPEAPSTPDAEPRPEAEPQPERRPQPAADPEPAPRPSPAPETAQPEPEFFDDDAPSVGRQLDPELLAEIARGTDRPRARAAAPQPGRSAVDGAYEVQSGETLWRVAFNTRGDDTDVAMAQQMLAVVIANPGAFDQGRIDRLMRGSRLEIPDRERVSRIDAAEAERLMAMLSAGQLRTQAVDPDLMPASATETRTEERPATDVAEARPEPAPEPATEPDTDATPEPAEAETAEGRSDPDASALLADRVLTEAQQRAAEAEREAVDPLPADDDAADDEADEDPAAAAAGPAGLDAAERAPAAPSTASPVTAGMNWQLILAGLGALFLLLALLLWRRRRVADDAAMAEAEAEEAKAMASIAAPSTATAAASEFSTADDSAASDGMGEVATGEAPAMTGEGDDPIADADFRIAYGMFDDAAERLQDAIRSEPERADLRLKLAEVHHAADQREAFLEAADAASGCGLDDTQRGELARMANRIAPDSRHASATAAGAGAALALGQAATKEPDPEAEPAVEETPAPMSEPAVEGEPAVGDEADFSSEPQEPAKPDAITAGDGEDPFSEPVGELDFDLDSLDSGSASEAPRSAPEEEPVVASSDDNRLDFDLDALDSGESGLEASSSEEPSKRAEDDNSLDFELDDFSFDSDADNLDASVDEAEGEGASSEMLQGEAPELSDTPMEPAAEPDEGDLTDMDDFSLADFDVSGDEDEGVGEDKGSGLLDDALGDETPESSEPEMAADVPEPQPNEPSATAEPSGDDFDVGDFELESEGDVDGDAAGGMAGNLEMAQAYLDLGENEMARPLLQEVAEKGDAEQQREAGELLEKLG